MLCRVSAMLQDIRVTDSAQELKYLVTPSTAEAVCRWAREHLSPDPHAGGRFGDEYGTTSLYFDTEELDVYRRAGQYHRSKFRIRRYSSDQVVFLERKLRGRARLCKRRTRIESGWSLRLAGSRWRRIARMVSRAACSKASAAHLPGGIPPHCASLDIRADADAPDTRYRYPRAQGERRLVWTDSRRARPSRRTADSRIEISRANARTLPCID